MEARKTSLAYCLAFCVLGLLLLSSAPPCLAQDTAVGVLERVSGDFTGPWKTCLSKLRARLFWGEYIFSSDVSTCFEVKDFECARNPQGIPSGSGPGGKGEGTWCCSDLEVIVDPEGTDAKGFSAVRVVVPSDKFCTFTAPAGYDTIVDRSIALLKAGDAFSVQENVVDVDTFEQLQLPIGTLKVTFGTFMGVSAPTVPPRTQPISVGNYGQCGGRVKCPLSVSGCPASAPECVAGRKACSTKWKGYTCRGNYECKALDQLNFWQCRPKSYGRRLRL